MNELKIRKIRPRSSDYYESVEGFITDSNDFAYLGFTVFNGEYLQVEMEMPNSSELDYDLYLAEEYEGSLYPFAGSENRTFINESSGTLPEHVGWHNKTGAEQTVYILVKSYAGSSTELPFTIHVGIAGPFDALDGLEPDTIHDPVGFDLPPVGYYRRISRTLYTRADNDWYVFDVPAASKIIGIQLENSPGHTTEIYTFADGQARRVGFTSAGVASSRKYYIRVINQKGTSLSGTNYQLDVTPREPVSPPPPPPPPPPQRTKLGEFIIENTPMYVTNPKAPDVNYKLGRTKWKCRGTLEFDMKESFPLDTCLLLYFPADHRNDMTGTEEIRIQYKKKFSVPLDYLYLSEYVYVSIWNDHWHDTDFTLAGSITSYA